MAIGYQRRKEWRAQLAEKFVSLLEDNGLQWKKEWHGNTGIAQRLPYNVVSGRKYNGENIFMLMITSAMRGYNDPRWATFNEIADKNGKYHPGEFWHLKKGSKAVNIGYAFPYDRIDKKSISWAEYHKLIDEGTRDANDFTMAWKEISLFNAAQIEGIKPLELTPEEKKAQEELYNNSISQDELVTKISQSMGVTITNDGGDRAYYSPLSDEIHLPDPKVFTSEYAYNSTALHELAHATGHAKRLDRRMIGSFGSSEYAYEELIAEITSCFTSISISASQTTDDINNHRAYVKGWCQAIKDDPDVLVNAISEATKAANYLDFHAGLLDRDELAATKDEESTWIEGVLIDEAGDISHIRTKENGTNFKEIIGVNKHSKLEFEDITIDGIDFTIVSGKDSGKSLVFKDGDDRLESLSEDEMAVFSYYYDAHIKDKSIDKETITDRS